MNTLGHLPPCLWKVVLDADSGLHAFGPANTEERAAAALHLKVFGKPYPWGFSKDETELLGTLELRPIL